LLMHMMLNDRSGGDAFWKEVWPKNGYLYRYTTFAHSVRDELPQYGLVDSFISCGKWLFECGNIAMDVNIAKTTLFYNRALDSQIRDAMEQGSASVLPEHGHLFTNTLEDRLTGAILEKQNWLDFVDMAQRKANRHCRRHQESKRRFRAWARSGLAQDLSPPPFKCHKSAKKCQPPKRT
jgi:hypothetical protein